MCHQADTAPAFLFSEQKKQVEEVLRVDPQKSEQLCRGGQSTAS